MTQLTCAFCDTEAKPEWPRICPHCYDRHNKGGVADRRRLEAELAVARMRLAALEVERWDDFSKDDPQSWPLYVHKWLEAELADLLKAYDELIYAVATKHEGETRHQTALRYIREAESRPSGGPSVAALTAGEETP